MDTLWSQADHRVERKPNEARLQAYRCRHKISLLNCLLFVKLRPWRRKTDKLGFWDAEFTPILFSFVKKFHFKCLNAKDLSCNLLRLIFYLSFVLSHAKVEDFQIK